MNWYSEIKTAGISVDEALKILNLGMIPSPDALKKLRRDLSMKHHPDRGGSNELMASINKALARLEEAGHQSGSGVSDQQVTDWWEGMKTHVRNTYNRNPQEKGVPEWQTDSRSSYNGMGDSWRDINRCKHDIWAKAKEAGSVQKWTFHAFDGAFLRSSFTVLCNQQTVGFGGEVMEFWNSKGGNPYRSEAVLASPNGHLYMLVRLKGRDVSKSGVTFESDSFNQNPSNSTSFMNELRRYVDSH